MVGIFSNNPVFNQPLNGWGSKLHNNVNLTNTFRGATAFNQPFCTWANWSAKKSNFVNMGLNACINGQCKAYP